MSATVQNAATPIARAVDPNAAVEMNATVPSAMVQNVATRSAVVVHIAAAPWVILLVLNVVQTLALNAALTAVAVHFVAAL